MVMKIVIETNEDGKELHVTGTFEYNLKFEDLDKVEMDEVISKLIPIMKDQLIPLFLNVQYNSMIRNKQTKD